MYYGTVIATCLFLSYFTISHLKVSLGCPNAHSRQLIYTCFSYPLLLVSFKLYDPLEKHQFHSTAFASFQKRVNKHRPQPSTPLVTLTHQDGYPATTRKHNNSTKKGNNNNKLE
ncbi:hypothetical protein F4814DRAFT_17492 [Daldinia grandis]|nr:hypothetical protein F4814DRAFT_17492 [Daldinia grandis]